MKNLKIQKVGDTRFRDLPPWAKVKTWAEMAMVPRTSESKDELIQDIYELASSEYRKEVERET